MMFQKNTRERFGEHISEHIPGGNVVDRQQFVFDTVADKVVPSINMLGPDVMLGILRECLSSFIVNVKGNGTSGVKM